MFKKVLICIILVNLLVCSYYFIKVKNVSDRIKLRLDISFWKIFQEHADSGNSSISPTAMIRSFTSKRDSFNETNGAASTIANSVPFKTANASIESNILSNISSQMCPAIPPDLVGKIKLFQSVPKLEDMEVEYKWLEPGGHYSPPCVQNESLAIIVPYRNRSKQLLIFLKNIHPFLRKQQLNYTLFLVEHEGNDTFNKGETMNAGFVEVKKMYNFSCYMFHDVDLLPENDRNLYKCSDNPKHFITGLNKWKYKLLYNDLFGGVVAMRGEIFEKANGFSNRFLGWGAEDDDFRDRIQAQSYGIDRISGDIGYYTAVKHPVNKYNKNVPTLMKNHTKYFRIDGLINANYTVLSIKKYLLYTRILVKLYKRNIF